jgi:hypothetical protein
MLAAAKQRLNLISDQLADARADLEATQSAALRAAQAAQTAQANAAKHAVGLHGSFEEGGLRGGFHHY